MNAQTISGTVTDYNGTAIANHAVEIMNTDSMNPYYSTTTTNASGAYSFTGLPSSPYGYIVSTSDCQNQSHTVFVSSNSGTANFSICSSNPSSCTAFFLSNPDSINQLTINFNDLSTGNPTAWSWDFGDGSTSTLQNPSHTYSTNGTYSVTLSISSALCSDSISQTIIVGTITPTCAAAFYYAPDSSNQNLIDFFDISTGNPTSWAWDFGDGSTSTLQNPTHTYASNGSYTVTLSIASANCGDSISQVVIIGTTSACQAAFTSMPDSNNTNSIIFTDQSTGNINSWNWSFGDGSSSTTQNPNHTYTNAGTYSVTLMVYGPQNCQSIVTNSITVGSSPSTYTISGNVMAGNNSVYNAIISLFDVTSNSFVSSTTSSPATGSYLFSNVAAGTYKVLATPDSSSTIGQNYAPTYYGDMLFWSTASVVTVNSNQNLGAINLIALPVVPSGNGLISGNIGTGSKSGSDNVIVNLLDNTFNLVATTKTDANGDYSFSNLAYDTYKIWVEIAGKVTTPISVTLNEANSTSSNNDFIETNGAVTPKVTSIDNKMTNSDINIYPNPVQNVLNVNLDINNSGVYTFNIFSITGQMISVEQINITSGNNLIRLNTNNLSSGSYILIISNDTNTSIQKLFTK